MTQSSSDRPVSGSEPVRPTLTPLERETGGGRERVMGLGAIAALLIAGWLTRGYWMPNSWLYSRKDTAPNGVSWLEFGTTRQHVLQKLAAEGGQWSSIAKPGMAPSAWAAHTKVTLGGQKHQEFAVIYSDAATYNYGAIPGQDDGPLNPASLASTGSDTAKVVAIRWKVPRSFTEANSAVPAGAAMAELGLPHGEEKDIIANGKVFKWEWPGVQAKYLTLDGVLILEQTEEMAKVNVHGGKGNLPSMAAPSTDDSTPGEGAEVSPKDQPTDAQGEPAPEKLDEPAGNKPE